MTLIQTAGVRAGRPHRVCVRKRELFVRGGVHGVRGKEAQQIRALLWRNRLLVSNNSKFLNCLCNMLYGIVWFVSVAVIEGGSYHN